MKKLIMTLGALFLIAAPASASEQTLVAVKGEAIMVMDFQGFKEFLIQKPSLVAFTATLGEQRVKSFVDSDVSVIISPNSAVEGSNCSEAVVTFTAGKGNVLPTDDGTEAYLVPEIVSFSCINK